MIADCDMKHNQFVLYKCYIRCLSMDNYMLTLMFTQSCRFEMNYFIKIKV
jgi:hypothetical protein